MALTHYGKTRLLRSRLNKRIRVYLFTTLALTLIIALCFVFIRASLFQIKKITFIDTDPALQDSTLTHLKTEILKSRLAGFLGISNYFAWPSGNKFSLPPFSKIDIEKKLFSGEIKITTQARQKFLIWCLSPEITDPEALVIENCYWLDPTGIAFSSAPLSAGHLLNVVFDTATTTITLGQNIIAKNNFEYFKDMAAGLKTLNINIDKIEVSRGLAEARFRVHPGVDIIFSLRFDPRIAALPALKKIIETPGLNKISYLNLTVENRAFYKPR